MKQSAFKLKLSLVILIGLLLIALEWWYGRIPQPLSYHHFADHRMFFGIPNFLNVASNFIFFIVGLYAVIKLLSPNKQLVAFTDRREMIFYLIFFIGVFFVCFGSGYYHWSPNNATLIWDRLPMTIAFMSFFSAMVAERINRQWGLILLPIAIVLGIASVVYWDWTMTQGVGDLRFYIFIQFYPMFATPLILILFRSEYSHTAWIWLALLLYVIAKLFEIWDLDIFLWTGKIISGHSLKHIAAALSCFSIWRYLVTRRI